MKEVASVGYDDKRITVLCLLYPDPYLEFALVYLWTDTI